MMNKDRRSGVNNGNGLTENGGRTVIHDINDNGAQAVPLLPDVLKEMFQRNVRTSQKIIAGEFEDALVDIIVQLENPPAASNGLMPSLQHATQIASIVREGLAGLPPNGFEFAAWLWDVAPLHVIRIPQISSEGLHQGYQYGFFHLRNIAAMLMEVYVAQQPQKVSNLIRLLHSSVGWLDAKKLVVLGMMGFYERHFDNQYHTLLDLAKSKGAVTAKIVPLVVAARMVAKNPMYTKMGLELIMPTLDAINVKIIRDGVVYALRAAALYGDQEVVAQYLVSEKKQQNAEVIRLFCELLNTPRVHWSLAFSSRVQPVLEEWMRRLDPDECPWLLTASKHVAAALAA